ncbi:SAM-dependent chlorinase/fluorinase [Luteolibacter sp. GHJ8]|uniref:SAM-dependent chlorinase/fluorinase n=1 Tax=Luteolibacter rhizosphaerae TaxID=2989719 RepID=A0ABT3GAI9_9BACT|nr:SAM hydroxide adenosyltransferase [Luteolibacter rhizosphaerae]MCW1916800.1 SAM-dependent chlorinase/fluorinase [Luteolibacter rhizosphaerae]
MRLLGALLGMLATILPLQGEVSRGEIEGAKYMIATPEKWEGKLVLIAHGYRPEGGELDGDFDAKDEFATGLLEKGWAIAATSYRRNGWIVEDAITDLKNLRAQVVKQYGEPKRSVLLGSSMGGLIGTLIAEGAMEGVDGVVLVGAYLGDPSREEGRYYPALKFQPKVPVLHLTNETELDHPKHYRQEVGADKVALWEIKRPGHCNVSDIERLNGVLAVSDWIEGKEVAKEKDGTVGSPERPSTARKEDGVLVGKVTVVSESWGNVSTDLVAKDFETLGLRVGDTAVLQGAKKIEVQVVRYWSDLEAGKAGVYLTPSGWGAVVVNRGNAAEMLGVKTGDEVRIGKK